MHLQQKWIPVLPEHAPQLSKSAHDRHLQLHPKMRPFMPRDNNKNNDSRGRRDRPSGGRGRSGVPRGPEKKFAKRGFGGKAEGERRPFAGKRDDRPSRRDDRNAPRTRADRPYADRPSRSGEGEKRTFRPREDRGGDKRPYAPRGEGFRKGSDRPRGDRPFNARPRDGDRPRGDRSFADRPERKFGGDKKFSRDRGDVKPWQDRKASPPEHVGREPRPFREGARNFDRPKFDHPRRDRNRDPGRPEGRADWQEHPRSEPHGRNFNRPRRDNEDDSKIFAKRPAFGGRGAYRQRESDDRRPARPPKIKKSGERIAKVVSRAGLASRRDAEEWIVQGRVTVNGRVINSPALDVTVNDVVTVDGKPLPPRERTRLFLFHKPRGLMTTHADPEGRPTVFDNLPEGLPRLISVGRLDFNTEGLLLLTNDGGLARALELPETGWLRRYRVRAHGEVTQAQLDELKRGVEVDGVKYGPIDATLERDQGANVWLVFAIREGKNREVRNVMAHLGLEVNRLIRVSYGPFQLAELAEGEVEEVKTRVLREQLGEKVATLAGADFNRPMPGEAEAETEDTAPRGKKPFKPAGKSALIADRKGRRVLVQRTGSEEARARNEDEANGYGPPRRPKRGYHGKRDLKPQDE